MNKKVKSKRVVLNTSSSSDSENAEDLEQELLKLSKRRKLDQETKEKCSNKNKNKLSYKASLSDSETSESDDDWNINGKSKVKKNRVKGKHKSSKTSEPEEGELLDSSSSSEIVEEVNDDNSSMGEFDDGYDEHLMGDKEDRAKLAQMTEKERELELFNRIEKREVLKTRFEIEKKLRYAKKEEMKRKAKMDEVKLKIDASARSKERRKLIEENKCDKKAQAIKDLRAEREKKKKLAEIQLLKQEKEEEEKRELSKLLDSQQPHKLKACDVYSEDDSPSESELEKSNVTPFHYSRSADEEEVKEKKPQYISSKDDLSQIKLSRFKLEKWVHAPFFNKTVIGSYIRVGIGNNNGVPIYRVAEVIDIVETPKVYQLGSARTNKGLKVKHGNQERIFRLEYVSNQDFTDLEYFKWKETLLLDGIPLPTVDAINEKLKDIQSALNYQYKDNDIETIIKEKEKFQTGPCNYAMKKTELFKQKALAEIARNREEIGKINNELEKLEERAKEIDKLRTSNISAISYINERNRQRNIMESEKAILEESKLNREKEDDPFTRRRCTPMLVTKNHILNALDPKISDSKIDPLKLKLAAGDNGKKELPDIIASLQNGHADMAKKNSDRGGIDNDLFSVHDFDIKLDLEVSPFGGLAAAARPNHNKEPPPKRSLNLEQYKRMRGLI